MGQEGLILDAMDVLGAGAGTLPPVDLGLVDLRAERLETDAQLPGDAGDGAEVLVTPGERLLDHPDRPFPQLRWIDPRYQTVVVA